MMDRVELIREYDAYYTEDPGKWTGAKRNRFAEQVLAQCDIHPRALLDVGCGNGHTLKHFGALYPQAELYGMDLSPVACSIARQNVKGSTILNAFVEEFSEPSLYFDLILCMGVAEHFLSLRAGFRAMRNLLSKQDPKYKQGLLYLEIPNCLAYSLGEEGYRRLSCGSRQMEWHLPRERWEQIIQDTGFRIVKALTGKHPAWEFAWVLEAA
jgi:SAM-dependent methyltransferase